MTFHNLFQSDYPWVLFAQPGDVFRFDGDSEGWVHVAGEDQPRKKKPLDVEAADAEEQARQDWSNDE